LIIYAFIIWYWRNFSHSPQDLPCRHLCSSRSSHIVTAIITHRRDNHHISQRQSLHIVHHTSSRQSSHIIKTILTHRHDNHHISSLQSSHIVATIITYHKDNHYTSFITHRHDSHHTNRGTKLLTWVQNFLWKAEPRVVSNSKRTLGLEMQEAKTQLQIWSEML
jgi:hypothetical protein